MKKREAAFCIDFMAVERAVWLLSFVFFFVLTPFCRSFDESRYLDLIVSVVDE
jgi:hypothetical protein